MAASGTGRGGAREGSGPKPVSPLVRDDPEFQTDDPDEFLRAVMKDPKAKFSDRMAAALAMKRSGKPGVPMGKKERQQEEAQDVVRGKLTPLPAPRPKLRVVG